MSEEWPNVRSVTLTEVLSGYELIRQPYSATTVLNDWPDLRLSDRQRFAEMDLRGQRRLVLAAIGFATASACPLGQAIGVLMRIEAEA